MTNTTQKENGENTMEKVIEWSKSFKNVSNSKCGRFVIYPQTAGYGLDDNGKKVSVAGTQKELKCVAARILNL